MDKATQRSLILAYCATNGSITVREAFEGLNINSPTKRISEIRKSGPTVLRYIGKQGGHMEGLEAFKDAPSPKKEEAKEEVKPVLPKYEPKPIKEAFTIGDMRITLNHDIRVMYFDFESESPYCKVDRSIPYDKIPDLVQFLAWAMRERMEVKADAEDQLQAEGREI